MPILFLNTISLTVKRKKENTEDPQTHLEVLRIHMQLVTVQLTELSKGTLEVVQILQAINKGVHYLLAMGLHLAVAHNSIRRGQAPKGVKEPLSPGVDDQQPEG